MNQMIIALNQHLSRVSVKSGCLLEEVDQPWTSGSNMKQLRFVKLAASVRCLSVCCSRKVQFLREIINYINWIP